jgi:hypothetical protein
MNDKILDWYFNLDKFIYGSKVSKYLDYYIIKVGRNKTYFDKSFNKALIKSTNNLFLKFIFIFVKFEFKRNSYYRNQFSGSNSNNWKLMSNGNYLAWDIAGGFNRENKLITKVKYNE